MICFAVFVLFPTTLIRPTLPGTTVWEHFLLFLYQVDAPDNLFPSIHCMIAWLCWVGIRGNRRIHAAWRITALLMAIAVCLSTLTTRQHVLADVAGGILLSEFCYYCAAREPFRQGYTSIVNAVLRGIEKITGRLRCNEQM